MSDLQDLWNNDREQLRQVRGQVAQLRADLDAALRESADAAAQRDTALGLCKERERELAEVRAERGRWEREFTSQCRHSAEQLIELTQLRKLRGEVVTLVDHEMMEAEFEVLKLELRDMQKARDEYAGMYDGTRAELAETRKAPEVAAQQVADVAGRSADDLESTCAELARSEARVKAATEMLTNVHVMSSQDAGQVVCASVVEDTLEALRNG